SGVLRTTRRCRRRSTTWFAASASTRLRDTIDRSGARGNDLEELALHGDRAVASAVTLPPEGFEIAPVSRLTGLIQSLEGAGRRAEVRAEMLDDLRLVHRKRQHCEAGRDLELGDPAPETLAHGLLVTP